jgi:hypothetical protein
VSGMTDQLPTDIEALQALLAAACAERDAAIARGRRGRSCARSLISLSLTTFYARPRGDACFARAIWWRWSAWWNVSRGEVPWWN